ncbi:MAG: winged helix-turn-helix transcriptional regulator [Candidatus Hodarchaeota archaeon]
MEIQQEMLQGCIPIGINGICLKPLTKYLKLISSKWMIFIIMIFPSNSTPLRYSEIKKRMKSVTNEKISDTTLSSRLNELVINDIIFRKQYNEIPPRVEYQLTKKGVSLQESLQPLIGWAINECHKA